MLSFNSGPRAANSVLMLLAALPLVGCNDFSKSLSMTGGTTVTSTVTGTGGNAAAASLVLAGAPGTEATSGTDYSFQPLVSGSNGTVVFTVSGLPSWLRFDANTGLLSGRPTDADIGTSADITITATAASTVGSIGPFRITVTAAAAATGPATSPTLPVNTAPSLGGTPPDRAILNQAYSFTPAASDAENDPLSFSIVNRPSWASFDTATGRLSGTPPAGSEGSYANILIRVSDGTQTVALPVFSILVSAPTASTAEAPVNGAPTIMGMPFTTVSAGVQYNFAPSGSDPNGDPLVYTVQNLPSWATFNSATGQIQGTPSLGDIGTYANIVVAVSDGRAITTLPAFKIDVIGTSSASVTGEAVLSWVPPAQNVDGTTLTDLAGYHISWGKDPNDLPNSMDLAWAGYMWMKATNLTSGTWYFSIRAYNSDGVESPAVVVSKSIS